MRDGVSIDEAKHSALKRRGANKEKFKRIYGVENYLKEEYFDLVVDTTTLNPEEVMKFVLGTINGKI